MILRALFWMLKFHKRLIFNKKLFLFTIVRTNLQHKIMSDHGQSFKGTGAQINVQNRFFVESQEMPDEFLNYCANKEDTVDNTKTSFLEVFPKTIVNKVESPDIGMSYSMNPYQGCKQGCIYCYARDSLEY